MKKLIFALVMAYTTLCHASPIMVANPIISRSKTAYTSSGNVSYLTDNKYGGSTFNVSNGSWIAIKVDAGPTKVFVNWNNPVYAWSNELAPVSCPNSTSFPVDYDLLTSSNSTNGADGDWTKADSIRGNIVTARGHLIDFTGFNWVKMQIITGGGQIDEVEIFDASLGDSDVWFFAGTSISANAFKGTPPSKNFADLITTNHPGYNPAMIRGGIGCINSTDFVNNLPKYLKMAGNAHYWAIEMGTNDAWGGTNDNVTIFKNNLKKVIDSCKAYGIQPIIARVLATRASVAKWQVHPDFLKAVDDLTTENNLIPGPDFYTWFLAHPSEINGGSDGVHPNATGAASMQRLWAEKMDSLYGGCMSTEIIPYIQVNLGALNIIASATVNVGDTVIMSPQVEGSGSWSWSGPDGFSSTTREIALNKIQYVQSGSYVVTFTNSNSCASVYTFGITVRKPVEIVMPVKSEISSIFPNPAEGGKFRILLNGLIVNAQVRIYDILGKPVYSATLSKNETEINAGLSKGIYIVKITNGQNFLNQKILVK